MINLDQSTDAYNRLLDDLLTRQLGRIRQRFLFHGIACSLVAITLVMILYYPLDRFLRLPGGVRILLSLAAIGYLAFLLHRFLVYPLRRHLGRRDVALAIERRFPELRQKLISAVQLGSAGSAGGPQLRNQSQAMINRLVAQAAADAQKIDPAELLDGRRTAKAFGAAGGLLAVVLVFAILNPVVFGIFLQRIAGRDIAYPRATRLVIEAPSTNEQSGPEYRVDREGNEIRVTLAAGGDLPVLVRADGVAPREVELIVSGGRGLAPRVTMAGRAEGLFKHVFRRVSGDFSFYARGGDDPEGDATVVVEVVRPPGVETIRAMITYPAYAGRPPVVQEGGSVEGLIGSTVQLDVKPTATTPVVSASIHFLESGIDLPLQPATLEDDGGRVTIYRGEIRITQGDRYEVRLVGEAGLRNPHPGIYHVIAVPDHPPVARLLSPLDDGLNMVLPDGIIPVRLQGQDDFGLTSMKVVVQGGEAEPALEIPLFSSEPGQAPVLRRTSLHLLDLAMPEFATKAKVSQTLLVVGRLADNRQPEAGTKEAGPRQVHVRGETELLRLISAHFRRTRDDVDQNLKLLLDRHERLLGAIEELREGTTLRDQHLVITTVEVAQGRIQASTRRIHSELMRAFDFHLFNRMEPSVHAGAALELYVEHYAASEAATSFVPEYYRDLARRRLDGRLGPMEKALDPVLNMTISADRIAHELSPAALEQLTRARVAAGGKDAAIAALALAAEHQRSMIEEFESLLSRLDIWNEFQDVIVNARALRDQQREIRERTKALQQGPDREPENR